MDAFISLQFLRDTRSLAPALQEQWTARETAIYYREQFSGRTLLASQYLKRRADCLEAAGFPERAELYRNPRHALYHSGLDRYRKAAS